MPETLISEKVMNYVEDACIQPANQLTKSFYREHVLVVHKYCGILASVLKCDEDIACISALLHDISVVFDFKSLPNHNTESAGIAERVLRSFKYPEDRIARVKRCISNHMSPLKINEGPLEDVVLSNADAISQIIVPSYWLYFAFKIRNSGYDEGLKWYSDRIENNWDSLIDPAKSLIEERYRNIRLTLHL